MTANKATNETTNKSLNDTKSAQTANSLQEFNPELDELLDDEEEDRWLEEKIAREAKAKKEFLEWVSKFPKMKHLTKS